MITINLICVGNLKEKFWAEAQNEYIKRLGKFCKFNIIEVQEQNALSSIKEILAKEGKGILEKIKGEYYVFDILGREFSSEDMASLIEKESQLSSTINFVIGGSYGISETVKSGAKGRISFGKITLPHNLFRVVAIEQIYRAMNMIGGGRYHK